MPVVLQEPVLEKVQETSLRYENITLIVVSSAFIKSSDGVIAFVLLSSQFSGSDPQGSHSIAWRLVPFV